MSEPRGPLVSIRDLRVHFGAGPFPVRAVDGVDLDVQGGETLALVGESGCGKSTLARAVVGLLRPTAGEIRFRGERLPILAERPKALCRQIQMVFQDPDASLNPRLTLAASVSEPIELHDPMSAAARERRVVDLFERVGLDPAMRGRYPHELSGGQRQRVCIARALAVNPDVIICDEAVSALDVSVQAQILNLLLELQKDLRLTYLFITHDLGVVRQIADRVAVMYLGQVVELSDASRLFESPEHPYTEALLTAVPSIDRHGPQPIKARGDVPSPARPPSGCRFHTRCPKRFDRCSAEMPQLYPVAGGVSRCFLSEAKTN